MAKRIVEGLKLLILQEAAALSASQFAFVWQAGQRRGLHFAIASAPPPAAAATPAVAPQEDIV